MHSDGSTGAVPDFALAVQWVGYCGRCGQPSPETRDSEAEAMRDAIECPCKEDDDA